METKFKALPPLPPNQHQHHHKLQQQQQQPQNQQQEIRKRVIDSRNLKKQDGVRTGRRIHDPLKPSHKFFSFSKCRGGVN